MQGDRPDHARPHPAARALTLAGRMLSLSGLGVLIAFSLFSTDDGARMLGRLVGIAIALPGLLVLCAGLLVARAGRTRRDSR